MSDTFSVRPGTVDDVDILARHRAGMFRDMGKLPNDLYDTMCTASRLYFSQALSQGEYLAWLASPVDDPSVIVAGAGMQLRPALPHIHKGSEGVQITSGLQGLVVNVYTEPAWRRQGLAKLLMRHVLQSAHDHRVASVVLHASEQGRSLYESLGFVPTNEMRYTGSTQRSVQEPMA